MIRLIIAIIISVLAVNAQTAETTAVEPAPLSVGLVVDNSGSLRTQFDRVVSVVAGMIDEKGGEDEIFLVRFVDASKIRLWQDFTHVKSELHDVVEEMFVEGGETALFDALKLSATHFSQSQKSGDRPRVLVLVTDGDEGKSAAKQDDVIAILKNEKIRVFTIGIGDLVNVKLLQRIAKETGGSAFFPKSKADTTTIAKQVWPAARALK